SFDPEEKERRNGSLSSNSKEKEPRDGSSSLNLKERERRGGSCSVAPRQSTGPAPKACGHEAAIVAPPPPDGEPLPKSTATFRPASPILGVMPRFLPPLTGLLLMLLCAPAMAQQGQRATVEAVANTKQLVVGHESIVAVVITIPEHL